MHSWFNWLLCFLLAPLFALIQAQSPGMTIPQIQGPGATSPYAGRQLAIPLRGCITGVTAEGFFMQDPDGDGDARTSDGIYVYRYSNWVNPRKLKTGDMVEIARYEVQEYYGQTEIAGLSDDKTQTYRVLGGCKLPAPVRIAAPEDPGENLALRYEAVEAQRVTLDLNASVVGPTQRFESRYPAGDPEITVVQSGSPYYGRRVFASELPVDRGALALSGGLGVDLPQAGMFDRITAEALTGILAYQFGRYVLLVDDPSLLRLADASVQSVSVAAPGPDEWTVCTFNAKNLFDAVDDGDGDWGAWAPTTESAYQRDIESTAALIRESLGSCTIVALQEIEGKDAVWADLARAAGPNYRFDYWEGADGRDITVGLLYDGSRVQLRGSAPAQACGPTDYRVDVSAARGERVQGAGCAPGTYPLYDRPPYVADLIVANAAGDRRMEVRMVVVHLKSKRGDEAANLVRRVRQAEHVATLLAASHTVLLGDFNDDLGSRPLDQFDSLINLYERHSFPADRYSYVYSGRAQAVDHILLSPELDRYFHDGGAVHVNADVAEPLSGARGRTSDHDPVMARFLFRPTGVSDALIGAACGAYSQPFRLK
jgi:predicted extracellular nuclease